MRKIISITLALAFILVSVTGLQLTGGSKPPMTQSQSIGNTATTTVNNAEKARQKSFYPKVAHEWGGYLFILAGFAHLVLNLKPMKYYLKIKS